MNACAHAQYAFSHRRPLTGLSPFELQDEQKKHSRLEMRVRNQFGRNAWMDGCGTGEDNVNVCVLE